MFLPVTSVGFTGDGRRHEPAIALRAVETVDFMTAHWAHLPCELLDVCSRRIVNEVKGVSRATRSTGSVAAANRRDGPSDGADPRV